MAHAGIAAECLHSPYAQSAAIAGTSLHRLAAPAVIRVEISAWQHSTASRIWCVNPSFEQAPGGGCFHYQRSECSADKHHTKALNFHWMHCHG